MTHGNTYTILFYLPQAPSHKHLHKNPIKEMRKGVATSLCASSHSTTAFEPVPRASRASRLFAGSLARIVRGSDLCLDLSLSVLAHSSFPCSSRAQTGSGSDTQPSQTTWPQAFPPRAPPKPLSHFSPALFLCSSSQLSQVLAQKLSSLRAPPSFGRVTSAPANRERTRHPSPCLSSLRILREMMSLWWGGPRGRFGGKSRRGHAAPPSVPRRA